MSNNSLLASCICIYLNPYYVILCRIDSANLAMVDILTEHFRGYPELDNIADSDTYNKIHVRRNHIWGDTIRTITQSSFNPINYLRVTFIGEPAVGEGGPCQEFFSLVLAKSL